jgi:hypothetical protein
MTQITVTETKEPETPEEYAEVLSNLTVGEASIILSLSGLADSDEEFEEGVQNVLNRGADVVGNPELLQELYPDHFNE